MPSKKKGAWQSYEHYRQTAQNQKSGGRASDWLNAIVGGPAGWYKSAAGEGGLGGTYGEHYADYGLSEEDYNLMTDEEHDAYERMNQNQRATFLEKMRAQRGAENSEEAKRLAAESELEARNKSRLQQQDALIAKVTAFANEMNMPVSELMQRDEFAQALNRQTYQNTMGAGLNTGAGAGGLSQVNADQATKNALLGYQFQRQQAGQSAMQNAYGMLANQGAAAEDIARYNQGLNLQLQQADAAQRAAAYQQGLGKQQGLGGMIGGIAGAWFGGPTGAAMGQQVGSQMAGQRYQQQNPYNPYKYSYPTSTRPTSTSGGGLSGAKYGNY